MAAHYSPLSQEGLLHIAGPDTLTFLQGQTTCDTRQVAADHTVPGAYCTPKGRMVCDFLLVQLAPEHYALRLRKDTLAQAAAAFGKYILFSRAELDAERDDWSVTGCWGEGVRAALEALSLTLPSSQYAAAAGEGYVVVQLDQAGQQFELYLDSTRQLALQEPLQAGLTAGDEAQWQALQITAGIGRVEGPNVGELLPQMLNYDATGHVSFNKGCYTGQEIVARLHYRGKAKRRLYLVSMDATQPPVAGTEVLSCDSGQACGTVINAAPSGTGCIGLVSATESGVAAGMCLPGNGASLELGALPYSIKD